MLQVFLLVLPVFIVLGTGSILMKVGLLNDDFIVSSNRLIFNFLLPVLLFSKIAHSDFSQVFNPYDLAIMGISILLIFLISFPIAWLLGITRGSAGSFAMNSFRGNFAYMGLPVSFYAFGEDGLAVASVLMAFVVPFVNILSVAALSLTNKATCEIKAFWKNTALNPLVIACFTGIIFCISQVPIPDFLDRTLSIISGVTLPMALFAIGATISLDKLKGNFLALGAGAALKLFALPLTAYLIISIGKLPLGLSEKVLMIMLGSPAATVNYVMASTMKGDPDLSSGAIVCTTLFSVVSFVFWLHFLGPSF